MIFSLFNACITVNKLSRDAFRSAIEFGTINNQNNWRLISKGVDKVYHDIHQQILDQLTWLRDFPQHINESDVFNISITNMLSFVRSIRLNKRYLVEFPKIIKNCYDKRDPMHHSNMIEINYRRFFHLLFGEPVYRTENAYFMQNVLVFASRQIMDNLLESDRRYPSQLDCWKFLYQFAFESVRGEQQDWGYDDEQAVLLPILYQISYKDLKQEQVSFFRQLTEYYGLIVYHHDFIYQQWVHEDIMHFIHEYLKIEQYLKTSPLLKIDAANLNEFRLQFVSRLLSGDHYDISSMGWWNMDKFSGIIDHCIRHLMLNDDTVTLHNFLMSLKDNRALRSLQNTDNIITQIFHDYDDDDALELMKLIIRVNMRYYENDDIDVDGYEPEAVITQSLYHWFVLNNPSIATASIPSLASDNSFNKNMLNELVNIHGTFEFDENGGMYFAEMICSLLKRRQDWILDLDHQNKTFVELKLIMNQDCLRLMSLCAEVQ